MAEQSVEEKTANVEEKAFFRSIWNFLKVRKVWWITPLILLVLLFLLSYLAGNSVSVTDIYAPV